MAAGEQFKYASLGIEGWFSTEQPLIIKNESINGFYINKVLTTNNLLRAGDIVLQVNGVVVDQTNLWYTIYNTPVGDTVKLQILRGGKEMVIDAKISEIKN